MGSVDHRRPHRAPAVVHQRSQHQHLSGSRDGVSLTRLKFGVPGIMLHRKPNACRWLQCQTMPAQSLNYIPDHGFDVVLRPPHQV